MLFIYFSWLSFILIPHQSRNPHLNIQTLRETWVYIKFNFTQHSHVHHTYPLHIAFFYSFLTLRTVSPEESHETEMYIVTVKKFLATVTSYRNYSSHTLLWQIMQSPLISLTLTYSPYHTYYIYFSSSTCLYTFNTIAKWISPMRIFWMRILCYSPSHTNTKPKHFSSQLIRRFSLKSSQQKPVLAETVIK